MMSKHWLAGAVLCTTLLPMAGHAAVTEAAFQLRSTGDLIELCTAAPTEPMGTAALNFCHGFAVGVYRVLEQENAARRIGKMFCIPATGAPSRTEALADFVQWAKGRPDVMTLAAADGVTSYLVTKFPCPRGK